MKLNAGKRILMFFHWLFSLLICAAFAAYIVKPDWTLGMYNRVVGKLTQTQLVAVGIAVLALYVILTVVQACIIFKRGKRTDRGFITVDSSDTGKVRIAISAIEQMVRQSVNSIDGITEMKIGIENQDDAIMIGVNASIVNGGHVPTVTMNMQQAIRQFVEMNCGVAVRSVSISIHSVTNAAEAPRRKRLGRGRAENAAPAEHVPATPQVNSAGDTPAWIAPEPVPAPATEAPEAEPEYEPEPAFEPASEEPHGAPETPTFDFDKPYESEFAKDLAAMKAAEAEKAALADAEGGSVAAADDEL